MLLSRHYIVFIDVIFFEFKSYFDSVDFPPESVLLPPPIEESALVDDNSTVVLCKKNSTVVAQNLARPLQVYRRRQ